MIHVLLVLGYDRPIAGVLAGAVVVAALILLAESDDDFPGDGFAA
jgi:hypothetical protein